jgi:hypothetical protein
MGQCSAQLVLIDGTILFCQLAPHQGQLHTFITDRVLAGQQDTTEACPSGKTEPHWEPMLGQCIHPSHRLTEEREA